MLQNFLLQRKVTPGVLTLAVAISLFTGLGAGLGVEMLSSEGPIVLPSETRAGEGIGSSTDRRLPDFVALAKRLQPVVVNVSASKRPGGLEGSGGPAGEGNPFNDFWGDYFGVPAPAGGAQQRSVGSGFIIGSDGTILTNYHVVEKAEAISVKLSDKREFDAKVLAKDPKTDIAIIKVNASERFPTARLGDSDRLEVGEWIMAVGNPFGLGNSVTSGIVSAKGRHIGAGPYDNFIQTDAAINPGNSGGPLVNIRGEVVGINMAILSQTGGNIGIGFATPINQIKELLPQLRSKGVVTRGWLGIAVQEISPEIAKSLGLKSSRGALVAKVEKDGPADIGGLQVGDVITEFDGKEIKEAGDLPILVARTQVDKEVRVKVLREAKEATLAVTVRELKETNASAEKGKPG